MKRAQLLIPVLAIVLTMGFVAPPSASAQGDVVAKVGGIEITKYELGRAFQKILPLRGNYHGGVSEEKIQQIKEEALGNLIEQAYKVRYALQEEIVVDNAQVEERYQKVRSQFDTLEEFQQALGTETPSAFRASIFRQLLANEAEQVAIDQKLDVTDEDVQKFYEENRMKFMRPEQFGASHILVRVDPASNDEERKELKQKAEELAVQAKAGEDFYNLAYYNSDDRTKWVGGDLGLFHEGQTVKEFEEVIKGLDVGQIAGPVKTMYGYHIIKLTARNEARQLPFEEVKGQVRATLEKDQRQALYQSWMDALKEKYPVERFDQ